MKCEIETSNGIMFLKGIDGDKRLEIADYIELHDSSLLMVSLILDKKEYFYWGKNHVIYTKLWGCIDSMMNVIVPFIYQHMQIEFNYIRAEKDNSHYLEGYDSGAPDKPCGEAVQMLTHMGCRVRRFVADYYSPCYKILSFLMPCTINKIIATITSDCYRHKAKYNFLYFFHTHLVQLDI